MQNAMPQLAALQEQIDQLRAAVAAKSRKRKDRRAMVNMRVSDTELASIDAACDARGMTRAELLRHALNHAIGLEIQERFPVHPQFRKMQVRRKPDRDRFRDGRTNETDIERADASRRAARKATMLNLQASAVLREAGDARDARNMPGLLAETVKKF